MFIYGLTRASACIGGSHQLCRAPAWPTVKQITRSSSSSTSTRIAADRSTGAVPQSRGWRQSQSWRRTLAVRADGSGKGELVRNIRAMPIKLVRVSKDKNPMAQEWVEKLERYTAVNEICLKPNPKGASSPQVQKDSEAEKVLKAIAAGDRVILLDERGRDVSSEDMARLLIKASDDGTPLCFVVGGPFGHGAAVTKRAHESIRLSRMVLNHSVAYVVLAEQLYRAWTIVRGEPYHH